MRQDRHDHERTHGQKAKTLKYDVAEQLRTPEEMAAYLDAWLEGAPEDGTLKRARWL